MPAVPLELKRKRLRCTGAPDVQCVCGVIASPKYLGNLSSPDLASKSKEQVIRFSRSPVVAFVNRQSITVPWVAYVENPNVKPFNFLRCCQNKKEFIPIKRQKCTRFNQNVYQFTYICPFHLQFTIFSALKMKIYNFFLFSYKNTYSATTMCRAVEIINQLII